VKIIDAADMEAVALGGAVYGTGGGGDPYIGKLLAQGAIRKCGPVQLINVESLADDALVFEVGGVGAPTVVIERLASLTPLLQAVEALEAHLGRRVTALMCSEAGGLNSTIPFAAASALGLPLLDGDPMGRAFPELQMSLFTLHGMSVSPLVLADEKRNCVVIQATINQTSERFARSITSDMGGSVFAASFPMSGRQVKQALIRGSISRLLDAGRALFDARARHADPVQALLRACGGRLLHAGKVSAVERATQGGFVRGHAEVQGLDAHADTSLRLSFQNEFLLARRGDQVIASTPDLICVVDMETGEPITNEKMRFGLRVAVLGIPCDAAWRTPAGLELVGPRYFGYEVDYLPLQPDC
jgi:DUF917 family protein